MVPPRKKPGNVLKRDGDFTRTIGRPGSEKPNPFAMVGQDLTAKLDSARLPEPPSPPPAAPAAVEEAEQVQAVPARDRAVTEQNPEAAAQLPDAVPEGPDAPLASSSGAVEVSRNGVVPSGSEATSKTPVAASRPMPERAGAADAPADVVITMRLPSDLVERAEKWATAVGLPITTVLRTSFNRFKPELMEGLRTLKAGDIQLNRAGSVGHHMQARLRFTPAERADMQSRLDPAGFGVLSSMLNHHARDSFAIYLDLLLADAGY